MGRKSFINDNPAVDVATFVFNLSSELAAQEVSEPSNPIVSKTDPKPKLAVLFPPAEKPDPIAI